MMNIKALTLGMLAGLVTSTVLAQTTAPDPWPPATAKEQVQWQTPPDTTQEGYATPTVDPNFASNIQFFPGHAKHCSNLLGGLLKCCREPTPDSQKDWWTMYSQNVRQGLAGQLACLGNTPGGATQMNGSANYSTLQQSLTSNSETVNGGGTPVQCGNGNTVRDTQVQYLNYEETNVKPNLGWYCNDEEFDLAVMRNTGECHYVGTRCATSVLGFCLVEKETYCCFHSPISRMIRESMLLPGENMGTAKNPDCRGISAAQFQSMDLSKVDLNETEARMQAGGFPPTVDGHDMESQTTGGGSTIGNTGRKTLTDRTLQRVSGMNISASQSSITANESITLPTQTASLTPTGAGQISFVNGYTSWYCSHGLASQLEVTRNGGVGTVSVTLEQATPWTFNIYQPIQPTTLTWGNGDTSIKSVPVTFIRNDDTGPNTVFFNLVNPTGGAVIAPYNQLWIDTYCGHN